MLPIHSNRLRSIIPIRVPIYLCATSQNSQETHPNCPLPPHLTVTFTHRRFLQSLNDRAGRLLPSSTTTWASLLHQDQLLAIRCISRPRRNGEGPLLFLAILFQRMVVVVIRLCITRAVVLPTVDYMEISLRIVA